MQLDRTRIVIRQRSLGDILDLSLKVIRDNPRGILSALMAGVIPLACLNALLLRRLTAPVDEVDQLTRYLWVHLQLVFLEAPLATFWLTPYLGQSLFLEQRTWREFVRHLMPLMHRILVCQVLLRGIAAGWLLVLSVGSSAPMSPAEVWLTLLCAIVLLGRLRRPYLNEIILLERNPLRAKATDVMSIGQRNRALHRASPEGIGSRPLVLVFVAAAMFASVAGSLHFVLGSIFSHWERDAGFFRLGLPFLFWLVVGFLAIVRFLSYLDLRIRREGWEVELLVRAAGDDFARRNATHPT